MSGFVTCDCEFGRAPRSILHRFFGSASLGCYFVSRLENVSAMKELRSEARCPRVHMHSGNDDKDSRYFEARSLLAKNCSRWRAFDKEALRELIALGIEPNERLRARLWITTSILTSLADGCRVISDSRHHARARDLEAMVIDGVSIVIRARQ